MSAGLLEGRTAFVTGAAGGQGAEICRRFALEGAGVLATDVGRVPVVEEIRDRGGQAWELTLDLSDRAALRRELPRALDELPSLDVVVCAAGVLSRHRLATMDDADWDRVLAVNLTAPVVITQLAWPYLQRSRPASVIHITSTSPRLPMLGVGPAYMASKAGLWSLVTLFAMEGAAEGIRVNGVAPGPILTPMIEKDYPTEEIQRQQTPLGRIGKPADIAAACAFLASSESSFITGTILNVSGGKLWGVSGAAGLERLSVHEFSRGDLPLDEFLEACARIGVTGVALMRANVEAYGLERAVRRVRDLGLTVTSLSAAGYWSTGHDPDGVRWTLADNLRRLDEAVALGTDLVVLAGGPLDRVSRDIGEARRRVAAGVAELWPHAAERGIRLAMEPLHPIFCPERSVVTSLGLALDVVEPHPARWTGVVVDAYHVWWDPQMGEQIERAGERIFAAHIDDFVLPLPPDLRRRGLMGEGCIDLARFKALVERTGYLGPYEVEVVNEALSGLPAAEAMERIAASYRAFMAGHERRA